MSHRPYHVLEKKLNYGSSKESFTPDNHQTDHCKVERAFIEFDDQGDKWAPQQTGAALAMVDRVRKRGRQPLLVLYIHGWKHNASEADTDLRGFEALLTDLSRQPTLTQRHEICGVYIGWRGDVISTKAAIPTLGMACIVRQVSILNRMQTADRIAHSIPFVQTLNHLASAARVSEGTGKCVFIGHSLGGRILENMATRSLLELTEESKRSGLTKEGGITNLADMVLLINPASEAQRARQTLLAVDWKVKAKISDHYVPAILSLKSKSDWATGSLQPFGLSLARLTRKTRTYPMASGLKDYSQQRYLTNPAAKLDTMLSHRVIETDLAKPQEDAFHHNIMKATKNSFITSSSEKVWQINDLSVKGDLKNAKPNQEVTTPDSKVITKHYDVSGTNTQGSYWVVELPDQILKGHSGKEGIFSPPMRELFAALYRICEPSKTSSNQKASVTSREVEL